MRLELNELMNRLGVGYEMSAYETCPWSVTDEEQGMTCSAEVRMGADGEELEVELQIFYDVPPEGKPPLEQVMYMPFKIMTGTKWGPILLRIKNEDKTDLSDWENKGCNFFDACVQEMKMGNMPDIDALIEREINKKERFSDQLGDGGGKSPKIKPQQLLGMKQGRGF